jgi:hypothetical protein
VRNFRKVKAQTARRQRIESIYNYHRESRGSRGPRGAQDASERVTLSSFSARAGRWLALARLAQRLGSRVC